MRMARHGKVKPLLTNISCHPEYNIKWTTNPKETYKKVFSYPEPFNSLWFSTSFFAIK
jgi:hypothetical protein